jgi:hypothetical protein
VLLLAGCAPADATPEPDPTDASPSTSAEPEPAALPGSRPDARTEATCADLATPASLDPLFAEALEPAPPTRTAEYIGAYISDEWFIRQSGGLACNWSSAESIASSEGFFGQFVKVDLLPASDADWAPFSGAEASGTDRKFACYEYGGTCELNQLLPNGWWLRAIAFGLGDDGVANAALAEPVFTGISGIAAGLDEPASPWSAPTPSVTLPAVSAAGDCEALLTSAQVQAATGEGGTITSEWDSYPSQLDAARSDLGVHDCRWTRDGFWDVLQLIWLPGGAWAQADAKAAMEAVTGSSVEAPAIAGVPAGSTAFYVHVDSAALDLVIGGNWVKLQLAAGADSGTPAVRADLLAAGAALAANFPG